jgi:pimeloyl-ACP methyl ester carboxylesterase
VGTAEAGTRAGLTAKRIESLLSARLFLEPQLADDRIYFMSNLSGHLSLFAMDVGGSVPEPLLPPQIALQNPELIVGEGGIPFKAVPSLGRVLVMIDRDGDENYLPCLIPLDGGFPDPFAPEEFEGKRTHLVDVDLESGLAYFAAQLLDAPVRQGLRADLETGVVETLGQGPYGAFPAAWTHDHARVVLTEGYTLGDTILFELDEAGARQILYGLPIEERSEGETPPLPRFVAAEATESSKGLLVGASLTDDAGAPGYIDFEAAGTIEPVAIEGLVHEGSGELEGIEHLEGERYVVLYNIDGCSWAYDTELDEERRTLRVTRVLVGEGELSGGILHGLDYDEGSKRFVLSYCTATDPTQIWVLEPDEAATPSRQTRERVLGISSGLLSAGEDASFESHDGLRVSARIYRPSPEQGFEGPRPLVYYVHGGPQSQERPNFAWFSMPLIQILTLEGFAVFVPNARGSTGYGLDYAKRVDRDWGGLDRLDHVHAMTEVLPRDELVDVSRAGVVGRSYGGYMSLMLASRHPELWRAAVDMFGPYDLITFSERIPETWKPIFAQVLGTPDKDRDFFIDRSPRTRIEDISAPLLVIQGQNDPRVVEQESRDLVEHLRDLGRHVDYLVFEDEGHDVLKLPNRVRCYDMIVSFFHEHL